MRKRNGFNQDTPDYFFKGRRHGKAKTPRTVEASSSNGKVHITLSMSAIRETYWLMTPQGLRFPNAINQSDLAPWLAPVIDNVDFFIDGTPSRSIMPQT
ncbi:hypothetical protein BASA83_012532 [Batrachochytrium salamandrivorans]|nr:hypothetical protein BASA83_012532 [Batrachochytrium salamandrivorans]